MPSCTRLVFSASPLQIAHDRADGALMSVIKWLPLKSCVPSLIRFFSARIVAAASGRIEAIPGLQIGQLQSAQMAAESILCAAGIGRVDNRHAPVSQHLNATSGRYEHGGVLVDSET